MDAANEKVSSNHIHDDVAFVVLSKLPLKSLIRFCCVQKSWTLLVENPYFMSIFRRNFLCKDHSCYNDTSFLLYRSFGVTDTFQPTLYSLSGERFENMIQLDWPNPFREQFYFYVCGSSSVNGIVCLKDAGRVDDDYLCMDDEPPKVVFWNRYQSIQSHPS